jgi:hypothetical protein
MVNETIPFQMIKALQEIDRLRGLIQWRSYPRGPVGTKIRPVKALPLMLGLC